MYDIIRSTSLTSLSQHEIIDTTGAGDSFIGGFLVGVTSHLHPLHCLRLATVVAAEKLKGMGARSTLPTTTKLVQVLRKG